MLPRKSPATGELSRSAIVGRLNSRIGNDRSPCGFLAVTMHPSGPAGRCVHSSRAHIPATTASDAVLLVSELVTNSAVHANVCRHRALTVEVTTLDDRPRIAVTDPGLRLTPCMLPPDPETPGGLGLLLVDELCEAWGIWQDLGTTYVWCELLLDQSPPSEVTTRWQTHLRLGLFKRDALALRDRSPGVHTRAAGRVRRGTPTGRLGDSAVAARNGAPTVAYPGPRPHASPVRKHRAVASIGAWWATGTALPACA
jgi:hypothetical protein